MNQMTSEGGHLIQYLLNIPKLLNTVVSFSHLWQNIMKYSYVVELNISHSILRHDHHLQSKALNAYIKNIMKNAYNTFNKNVFLSFLWSYLSVLLFIYFVHITI
jgi:hypothetical protein